MIYFYQSTRKSDKLTNPVTIMSSNPRRADALAVIKFLEWGYKGSPVRIAV